MSTHTKGAAVARLTKSEEERAKSIEVLLASERDAGEAPSADDQSSAELRKDAAAHEASARRHRRVWARRRSSARRRNAKSWAPCIGAQHHAERPACVPPRRSTRTAR